MQSAGGKSFARPNHRRQEAEEAMEAVAADPTADVDTESGENDTKEDAG